MKDSLKLTIEQKQNLKITQELKQSFEILQMNIIQLASYIETEILENPILEIDGESDFEKGTEDEIELENNLEEYYSNKSDYNMSSISNKENLDVSFENFHVKMPTLYEFLEEQLGLLDLPDNKQNIAKYIIGNINENGYLEIDNKDVADKFKCTDETIEELVLLIQSFEPLGVGARSLSECLLIQLKSKISMNDFIERLLSDHLTELASGKWNKLSKITGKDIIEIQEVFDLIKSLNPKPGKDISNGNAGLYILPDVIVEKLNDEYFIIVNDSIIPKININKGYKDIFLKNGYDDKVAIQYIEQKLKAAKWIIKAINQRKQTINKVAEYILEYQKDYFENSMSELRPLTLKQIALELEIHESTVSRSISGKYIQTPKGLFEMKCFFDNKIKNCEDKYISSNYVKNLIKGIIDSENKYYPLSDQQITQILRDQGLDISRRTIAKYRDDLNIHNAAQRRRF